MGNYMRIEISNGEILDKLTILEIKNQKIKDPLKLINVRKELIYLKNLAIDLLNNPRIYVLYERLKDVNSLIWNVEESIRIKENKKEFDDYFINLARAVYLNNDYRARLKKQINHITDSGFFEEKSHSTT